MPSPLAGRACARLWVLVLCWLGLWAPLQGLAQAASAAVRAPAIVLHGNSGPLQADGMALAWADPRGTAVLEEVLQGPARFAPVAPDTVFRFGPGTAVWLKFNLTRASDQFHWVMSITNPVLDRVTLYQQDAEGRWQSQAAGDTVPVARWAEPGRYPSFRLELPAGQPREVLLQVRSLTPTSLPVRLASERDHTQEVQMEYLGLGLASGAMLLLIAACLAQAWGYRDPVYAWYAAYAAVSTLTVVALTGVGAHLLWPRSGFWADSSQGSLACVAAAAAMMFVRHLAGIGGRHRILYHVSVLGGWAGLALAVGYLLLPRTLGLAMMSAYVLFASAVNILVAWLAWRRRDNVGLWVLVAYLPLTAAILVALARLAGWLPHSWLTHYAVVIGTALEVPLLLVALAIRSRERHGAEIREQALSSQDALTGLLAAHLFHDRLAQVVARYKRDKEPAAVVFIDLVNHGRIKAQYGSAAAEQSLLRSVIKLRRLVREIDTLSRVGEARFGLIMEGVQARAPVTDRAARLIAAGLMPLRGLKPDVTLQFHIAAVLLNERRIEASELPDALHQVLAGMSPRTRRPIRYLEPEVTQPSPLESDSGLADSELPQDAAAVNG